VASVFVLWIDGRVIPLRDLPQVFPRNVRGLIDDANRSLAWMVRMAGAYKNLKQPFQEFEWARFFRQHIRIDESSDAGWQTRNGPVPV
jgi:hypothetical protein